MNIKPETPYLDVVKPSSEGEHPFTSLIKAVTWMVKHPEKKLIWYGYPTFYKDDKFYRNGKEYDRWELIFATVNSHKNIPELVIKDSKGMINNITHEEKI